MVLLESELDFEARVFVRTRYIAHIAIWHKHEIYFIQLQSEYL